MKKKRAKPIVWEQVETIDPNGVLPFNMVGGVKYIVSGDVKSDDGGRTYHFVITGIGEQARDRYIIDEIARPSLKIALGEYVQIVEKEIMHGKPTKGDAPVGILKTRRL